METIFYDEQLWNDKLLPALVVFYENCVAPDVVRISYSPCWYECT